MFGTTMACPHCSQAVLIEHAPPAPAPKIDVHRSPTQKSSTALFAAPKDDSSAAVAPPKQTGDAPTTGLAPSADLNPPAEAAELIDVTEATVEVPGFVPQSVDHLLPPRFATLDPAFFYRRGNPQDQVLLPQADGSVQAVSNRIVTVVHNGREYQLISSPRYRRNMNIIVNTLLMFVAAVLMVAIWWAVA